MYLRASSICAIIRSANIPPAMPQGGPSESAKHTPAHWPTSAHTVVRREAIEHRPYTRRGMRVQRITKIQIVLAGLILVGMFGVGIAFAWMQDTTYAKVLTGQVTDERSKQPLISAIVRI